ncbi:MAG: hypothetical protein AB1349_11740 [Elusimicrobiota bacterium]
MNFCEKSVKNNCEKSFNKVSENNFENGGKTLTNSFITFARHRRAIRRSDSEAEANIPPQRPADEIGGATGGE